MKTTSNIPESITIDDRTITKNQFIGAMLQYGDEEGYSFDEFSCGMTWLGIVSNEMRSDGKTEREVWLPLLDSYF